MLHGIKKVQRAVLPHICIICSLILLVFCVIEMFNKNQAFLENDFHKWILGILSVASLIEALDCFFLNRKMVRAEYRRRHNTKETLTSEGRRRVR